MSLANLIRYKESRKEEAYLELDLIVVARSSRSRVAAVYDERLKIQLAAAPVDGQANAELLAFLASLFKLPKSNLELSRGLSSKRKTVKIKGLRPEQAAEILSSALKRAK